MKIVPIDMAPGTIHKTTNFGNLSIVLFKNKREVVVNFVKTGFSTTASVRCIRDGQVKDKLMPTVFGVGYIGSGPHVTSIGRKKTASYKAWFSMLLRCYCPFQLNRKPSYRDCSVCAEWLDFQNFAAWFDSAMPLDGQVYHLDKDTLVEGNRVYSPSTCRIIPRFENISHAAKKMHRRRSNTRAAL